MARRPIVLVAAVAVAASILSALPAEADPALPHPGQGTWERRRRFYPLPLVRPPAIGPRRPVPPFLVTPPGRFIPPAIGRRPRLDGDRAPIPPSLPQGFHLTVPLDEALPPAPGAIDQAYAVGKALGACWAPPAAPPWRMITLRLSFRRDGSVNGEPRVPYTDAGSTRRNADLARSLLGALKRCTPLPFSPSLGSAIAGEIFAISFTHQDQR